MNVGNTEINIDIQNLNFDISKLISIFKTWISVIPKLISIFILISVPNPGIIWSIRVHSLLPPPRKLTTLHAHAHSYAHDSYLKAQHCDLRARVFDFRYCETPNTFGDWPATSQYARASRSYRVMPSYVPALRSREWKLSRVRLVSSLSSSSGLESSHAAYYHCVQARMQCVFVAECAGWPASWGWGCTLNQFACAARAIAPRACPLLCAHVESRVRELTRHSWLVPPASCILYSHSLVCKSRLHSELRSVRAID